MLEAAKTGPVTLEVAAARALRRLLANARGPPVRAANILHIVVEVKAVFPTRRRARWNSMAVDVYVWYVPEAGAARRFSMFFTGLL